MHKSDTLEISISILHELDNNEAMDCFLDEFTVEIENLDMMCGGGFSGGTGIHNYVISFVDETEGENETIVNKKIRVLQKWIINHRFNPVILLWKVWDEMDEQ